MINKGDLLLVDRDKKAQKLWASLAPAYGLSMITTTTLSPDGSELDAGTTRVIVFDTNIVLEPAFLLRQIAESHPETGAVACAARPRISEVVQMMKAGAADYLEKPLHETAARMALHAALAAGTKPVGLVPIAQLERDAIRNAIAQLGGDKLLAARLLGIGKTTLYRKLREYGSGEEQKSLA
jgi:DNA-binding NtrC family response regulator